MFKDFKIQSQNSTLFCRESGQGDAVLFIHGACEDSDFFLETAQLLAAHYRVILYDRRGYGRSGNATSGYEITKQTEDAAAVIHHTGSPCRIIAHSAGTAIAMELAAKHPELVISLLLYEPVAEDCIPTEREDADIYQKINAELQKGKLSSAMLHFTSVLGKPDPRAKEATAQETDHMMKNSMCFFRREFAFVTAYHPNYTALASVPITVGVGELSRNSLRYDVAHNLARNLNAQLLYFPGSHNCPRDLPTEFAFLSMGILASR